MTSPLTPGWAQGPPVNLSRSQLDTLALIPFSTPTFPSHTRLGLLEQLHLPPPTTPFEPPPHTPPGFIAVIHDLTAHDVLLLIRLHASGVLLTGDATQHALIAARAAGLPVSRVAEPQAGTHPQPPPFFEREGVGGWVPALTPVLPVPLARVHTGALPWLELVSGQPEERHLARQLLDQRRACGIGLLRIEFVVYATPGIDQEALQDILTDVLTDFSDVEVHIRLSDWAPDKPPPQRGELSDWNGMRGLAGIVGTSSFAAQVDALLGAQAASGHARMRIIAPYVEDPAHVAKLAERVGAHRCVAMIESPEGLRRMEEFLPYVWGFAIGLGDLSRHVQGSEALTEALDKVSRAAGGKPVMLCGRPMDQGDRSLVEPMIT